MSFILIETEYETLVVDRSDIQSIRKPKDDSPPALQMKSDGRCYWLSGWTLPEVVNALQLSVIELQKPDSDGAREAGRVE